MSNINNNRTFDLISNLITSELGNFMTPQPPTTRSSTLATTIVQSEGRVLVYTEMPGFNKQSIDLDFHNNKLIITGRKEPPVLLEDEKTTFSNINYGSFSTTVKLPISVVDKEKVNVKYDNGILRIMINLEREDRNRFTINFGEDAE
jgi:HSP20 family protein